MHTATLRFSKFSLALDLDLDQLTKTVAEFRKRREQLQHEHIVSAADVRHKMYSGLKLENKGFFTKNSYVVGLFLVTALAVVAAQVWWIFSGQEPDEIRAIQADTLDPRYPNVLESLAANQLEERIFSLTEKMATLSGLVADLESKLIATDKLEARIAGLTKNLERLDSLATNLESQQMAADKPEGPISNITQETPAIETQRASLPASPGPKPVTNTAPTKRETAQTLPKERLDSVVSKQTAYSGPQNGPWAINLISSPDKADAVRFSNMARSRDVRTELQEIEVKGTPYWRVQVTGFSTQGEAKANADTVKDKLGLTDIWIMKR